MKKLHIFFAALLFLGSTGCTDFLNLPARNEQTIASIKDVRQTLNGYLRGVDASNVTASSQTSMSGSGPSPLISAAMIRMFEAYSDNIDIDGAMLQYLDPANNYAAWEDYRRWFLWNDYATPGSIWNGYYQGVGFLNTLIYELENISATEDPDEWERVMGEMLVHRAYFFFKLLQYFAPYDNNEQGVPVYLNTGSEGVLGVQPARSSHTQVYETILKDLAEAERLLDETTPRQSFNIFFRKDRLYNLLAQVYWFKAGSAATADTDWANAAKYAQMHLDLVPDAAMPRTGSEMLIAYMKNGNPAYPGHFIAPGVTTGVGTSVLYGHYAYYSSGFPKYITASQDLFDLFEAGDVRLGVSLTPDTIPDNDLEERWDGYFLGHQPIINPLWQAAHTVSATNIVSFGNGRATLFKPEEAYLILAEALYHTGGNAGATLDKFKSFRNAGGTGKSGAELLQEIMNERRKEFFMDTDHRWIDLKKYGGVTITRDLTFPESDEIRYDGNTNPLYKAVPGGYQYALPIPMSELQVNTNLVQNPGWTGNEF